MYVQGPTPPPNAAAAESHSPRRHESIDQFAQVTRIRRKCVLEIARVGVNELVLETLQTAQQVLVQELSVGGGEFDMHDNPPMVM